MDISSASLNEYYAQFAASKKTDALSSKLGTTDASKASDDELMEVCKEFESYLLEQVYKNMLKTTKLDDEDEDPNAQLVDFFKDQTIQEITKMSTEQNSIGLAQMLYDQMKVNMGITSEELAERTAESGAVTPADAAE